MWGARSKIPRSKIEAKKRDATLASTQGRGGINLATLANGCPLHMRDMPPGQTPDYGARKDGGENNRKGLGGRCGMGEGEISGARQEEGKREEEERKKDSGRGFSIQPSFFFLVSSDLTAAVGTQISRLIRLARYDLHGLGTCRWAPDLEGQQSM